MTTQAFAHVGIAARDMRRTEEFYTRHFGFRRARVVPVGDEEIIFLKTASGDLCLEVFKAAGDPPAPPVMGDGPQYPGFRHLAFQVELPHEIRLSVVEVDCLRIDQLRRTDRIHIGDDGAIANLAIGEKLLTGERIFGSERALRLMLGPVYDELEEK